MPAGDVLEVGGAELRAEAMDEKRNSIAVADTTAQRAASLAASNAHRDDSVTDFEDAPTPEDMVTLRRVPNKIPVKLLSIGFIELCERFSYYGTTIVCKFMLKVLLPRSITTLAVHFCLYTVWRRKRCFIAASCPTTLNSSRDGR